MLAPLPEGISIASDATSADWLVANFKTYGKSVDSTVPSGYTSYVRVFHPAYYEGNPVRWAEIAAANGTVANPGMQLASLTGDFRYERDGQPGVYDRVPDEGNVPPDEFAWLVEVLSEHTTTPDRCWLGFWAGWAATRDRFGAAPTFTIPARQFHLLMGSIRAIRKSVAEGDVQSPNLWWPADRAWCVATEIDFKTTYIGCDDSCAETLVGSATLEALAIDPTTGVNYLSDPINALSGD